MDWWCHGSHAGGREGISEQFPMESTPVSAAQVIYLEVNSNDNYCLLNVYYVYAGWFS